MQLYIFFYFCARFGWGGDCSTLRDPDARCRGGWLGFRTGVERCAKSPGQRNSIPGTTSQSVRSESPYRLCSTARYIYSILFQLKIPISSHICFHFARYSKWNKLQQISTFSLVCLQQSDCFCYHHAIFSKFPSIRAWRS